MDTAPRITTRMLWNELTNRLAPLEKTVSEMDAELHGNGVPGLNERMRVQEAYMKEIRNTMRVIGFAVAGDILARIMGLI